MSRLHKIVWALGVVAVSLFVLLTGRANIRNFERLSESIEAIYRDRLVVKGLIYDLAALLHEKEIASIEGDAAFYERVNESVDAQIDELIREFRETQLTRQEEKTLDQFAEDVDELQSLEEGLVAGGEVDIGPEEAAALEAQFASLHGDLEVLSRIQIAEGRRRVSMSDKAVDSMNTFARIENVFLLVASVLLIVLVFVVPGEERSAPGA